MKENTPITVAITPGTILMTIVIVMTLVLGYILRDLLLVIITAIVFASAIEPATRRFMRWGLPRVLSVVLLYLGIITLLVTLFYFFVPPLLTETTGFLSSVPTYLESLSVAPTDLMPHGTEGSSLTDQLLQVQNMLKSSSSGALSAASSVFGGVISFTLIVVLSFYFAVQERGIDDFLRIITPLKRHEYILDLWKRAQAKIGLWLQGQLLLSLIVGVLVYIGLLGVGWITGMPIRYALLLAIVAAVLELIPVFGSILAAIPAIVITFLDAGTSHALIIIGLYIVINQFQGNLIYPLVVQKVLGVPPLVVILAIIAGAQLGGFLGILIAVPIAAAVKEYIADVQKGKQRLAYPSEDGTVA